MLYAQVVFGLPVEGPFDYLVPAAQAGKVCPGGRVWAPFGRKRALGYVVRLSRSTKISRLKEISEVIDAQPLLDRNMLEFARRLAQYYCCSWGEAIEAALPQALRKGKIIPVGFSAAEQRQAFQPERVLLHEPDFARRCDRYLSEIQQALAQQRAAVVLLPDINAALQIKDVLAPKLAAPTGALYRNMPRETEMWLKVRSGEVRVIFATRSGVFAPAANLGLIIIEEEEDSAYKQDQAPHYHAREAAMIRAKIEKAKLILGSAAPSLESYYLAKKGKINYSFNARNEASPQVKIVDMQSFHQFRKKGAAILSRYLEDAIAAKLQQKQKILVLLNRKGFATAASCNGCGEGLKCPRCATSLVFDFQEGNLSCRYCNFVMPAPKICPKCNAGYISYSGLGTQKLESELSRIFPQAKISRFEKAGGLPDEQAEIIISTALIKKGIRRSFDLVAVLGIDSALNRVDLRAAEKAYALLAGLLPMAKASLVIQTAIRHYHVFRALEENDAKIFYDQELETRRQLDFPPFRHLALVKLRGRDEEKVKKTAAALGQFLTQRDQQKGLRIGSCSPGLPPKLRDNFYWQILISGRAKAISAFLKINLKEFPHSGIIVTVDIDPL